MYDELLEAIIKLVAEIRSVDVNTINADTEIKEEAWSATTELSRICKMLEVDYNLFIPYMRVRFCKTLGSVAEVVSEMF